MIFTSFQLNKDGQTPFILMRKDIGALFWRDWSSTVFICQEIHSEFSMSCLRGVATPDPWNTSIWNYCMTEFQGSGKRTTYEGACHEPFLHFMHFVHFEHFEYFEHFEHTLSPSCTLSTFSTPSTLCTFGTLKVRNVPEDGGLVLYVVCSLCEWESNNIRGMFFLP